MMTVAGIEFAEGAVREREADRGLCVLATEDRVFWTDSGRGSPTQDLFRVPAHVATGIVC